MVQRVAAALVAAQADILAENAADVEQAQGAIR
jgi:gamma-glutamyl phosphate reductase